MDTNKVQNVGQLVTSKINRAERDLRQRDLQTEAAQYHHHNPIVRVRNNIIPVSTAASVRETGVETRPCYLGYSSVHRLRCGHTVLLSSKGPCADNCRDEEEGTGNAPIHCLLCFRQELTLDSDKKNSRWHDLLMPDFIYSRAEEREKLEAMALERPSEPAYLGIPGWIVLPRLPHEVAMVRSSEKAKEGLARQALNNCFDSEGWSDEDRERAMGFFIKFLEHAHELNYPSPMLMAYYGTRMSLVLKDAKTPIKDDQICRYFEFDSEEDDLSRYDAARKRIIASTSADLLMLFCKQAPSRLKQSRDFRNGTIKRTAWYIWVWVQKHIDVTNSKHRLWLWDQRFAIMAGCIAMAMKEHAFKMTFFDICKALKMDLPREPDYSQADDPEAARDQWEASAEGKRYIGTMRAYGQLSAMVSNKDFRNMLVRTHGQRRRARRRGQLAAQDTSDADTMLTNFGL